MRRFVLVLVALIHVASVPSKAQLLSRVASVVANQPGSQSLSTSPLAVVKGRVLFIQDDSGRASLWSSDGTSYGSQQIFDPCLNCTLNPQVAGVDATYTYLWLSNDPVGSPTLWRTDGTRAGTAQVVDGSGNGIDQDGFGPGEPPPVVFGNRLILNACIGSVCGAVAVDGASTGSQVVVVGSQASFAVLKGVLYVATQQEIFELTSPSATATPFFQPTSTPGLADLIATADHLFFKNGSDPDGQVWASDGTPSGTQQVTSLPSSGGVLSVPFAIAGNRAFFAADDVTHGQEVWSSDGTPAGTRRETDFSFASPFEQEPSLVPFGNTVVFLATDGINAAQLWTTSGSGGAPVALSAPCGATCGASAPIAAGGRVVFTASDAAHGNELWGSDGTTAGTLLLRDLCPGTCSTQYSTFVAVGNKVVFAAVEQTGTSVWVTDGTARGTVRLAGPIPIGSILNPTAVGSANRFFFGFPTSSETPLVLWSSDGTTAAPDPLSGVYASSSLPSGITPVGNSVVYAAGQALWGLPSGSSTPTQLAASVACGGATCSALATANNLAFYMDRFAEGDLWVTDGSAAGTRRLTTNRLFEPDGMTAFGNKVAFLAAANSSPTALWVSDGTVAGTQPFPIAGAQYLQILGSANGRLFVSDVDGAFTSTRLIETDGTVAGTVTLLTLSGPTSAAYVPHSIIAAGAEVFFAIESTDVNGVDLWRTNGTAAGTAKVGAFPLGESTPWSPVALGDSFFFLTATATGDALERVTATPPFATTVQTFSPGTATEEGDPQPSPVAWNGKIYFVENAGGSGDELWSSDGTAAGTTLVRDIRAGSLGSTIGQLAPTPDALFLTADDGIHGKELWRSDGTAAGTHLVEDLAPGLESSLPYQLTPAPGYLYLSANDSLHGQQLWYLPLTGPNGCTPSATRLCLSTGRFQVEADWKDFSGNIGVGTAVQLTPDTGYFWFFNSSNVEVVVKILDGQGVNGEFWVFYGALSSVDYTLTVTDSVTGARRVYYNPSGNLASVADTTGFGPLGSEVRGTRHLSSAPRQVVSSATGTPEAAGCTPAVGRLCLGGGRFAVTITWQDAQGQSGSGTAANLTGDTGYFWFFDASNLEVVLKVIDGTAVNGKFWVFYGALSDVSYRITVTDTQTGRKRVYTNPQGNLASVADTSAF